MPLPPRKAVKKSQLQLQNPPTKFNSRPTRLSQKFLAACAGGNIGVARACLRFPIDINYSDGAATPLTSALACLTGDSKAIVRLAEHSSLDTVNTKDDEGETPIMLAVWEGNTDAVKEMVKIPGIDLNITNKWGHTLVDVCRKRGFTDILAILMDEKDNGRKSKSQEETRCGEQL